jgi:hypothetical protein
MAGKKKEKFRITMFFACNTDGSECIPPMYIGKAKKPCCVKKQSPAEHGFIIGTTRRLGWPLSCSKSKQIIFS